MAHHVLEVGNVSTRLVSGLDDLVDKCLAVKDPNAEHDPSYKAHVYDGLIRFFDRRTQTFPAGLTSRLKQRLEKRGHTVELTWLDPGPVLPPLVSDMLEGIDLRPYQMEAGSAAMEFQRGILWLATNSGKCLAAGTRITLSSGEERPVEQVAVGDLVVSLDTSLRFTDRPVTAVKSNGRRLVYDVLLRNGQVVRCTGNHPFLVDADTWCRADHLVSNMLVAVPRRLPAPPDTGAHVNPDSIRLLAYMLAEGTCPVSGSYRFTNASPTIIADFIAAAESLGSGVRSYRDVRSGALIDHHLVPPVKYSREPHGAAIFLDAQGLRGKKSDTKTIPEWVFHLAAPHLRIFLKAFMSCDGYVGPHHVEVGLASPEMVRQLATLLLRFGVWGSVRRKRTNQGTFAWVFSSRGGPSVQMFMQEIGSLNPLHHTNAAIAALRGPGKHDVIPVTGAQASKLVGVDPRKFGLPGIRGGGTRLTRHVAARLGRQFNESTLFDYGTSDLAWVPVVSVTPQGREETFDLTVEGTHNFIANNVVTHNTEVMSAILRRLVDAGMSALVIVPNSNLLVQTAARIKLRLGDVRVGMAGAGKRDLEADIIVATYQTLQQALPAPTGGRRFSLNQKRTKVHSPELAALLRNVQAVFVDEAHHAASPVYRDILRLCVRANYRLGLTGTVDKHDRRGHSVNSDAAKLHRYHLESFLGPVLDRVTNAELIDLGVSAKPRIYVVSDRRGVGPMVLTPPPTKDSAGNVLPGYNPYKEVFTRAVIRDERYLTTVVEAMRLFIDQGFPPFVFSHSVEQLKAIQAHAKTLQVPVDLLYGADSLDKRAHVLREYVERQDRGLLASSIFDEGADVPAIRAIFLAGARKSPIELLQRLGRGVRKKLTGVNEILVLDFDPLHSPMLHDHCEARVAIYQHEGFSVRYIRDIGQLDAIFTPTAAGASPG